MLNGIGTYCGTLNLPGLREIQYLPTVWVDSAAYRNLVNPSNIWTVDVPILQGSWLSCPVLPESNSWNEDPQVQNGLTFYRQSITGQTPVLSPSVTGEFEKMANYDFLIRIRDRNNQWWIMGTLQQPFTFSAPANTSQVAGYAVAFTANVQRRAHGYNPPA